LKKIISILILTILLACSTSDRCTIDFDLITEYRAEIAELNSKIDATTDEIEIQQFRNEITLLEDNIERESDRCN